MMMIITDGCGGGGCLGLLYAVAVVWRRHHEQIIIATKHSQAATGVVGLQVVVFTLRRKRGGEVDLSDTCLIIKSRRGRCI